MVKVKVNPKSTGTSSTRNSTAAGRPRTLPPKQGFITRCMHIIVDDIRYRISGWRSPDREKWEEYERFCRMAREGSVRK